MQSRFKVRDIGWQRPQTHMQIAAQRETCCNYDNIVSREICLIKELNWCSSVKALVVDAVKHVVFTLKTTVEGLAPLGIGVFLLLT